jgi:hypothetical protein
MPSFSAIKSATVTAFGQREASKGIAGSQLRVLKDQLTSSM